MKTKLLFIFSFFFVNIVNINDSFSLTKDDQNVKFLMELNTLKSDFNQLTLTPNNQIEKSTGQIIVKKPDSILLDLNSKDMKIKLVSINGNVKMIDKEINQTTYIDNNYSELMQFFTKNLKPEKLYYGKDNEVCMKFKNQGNDWEG